MIYREPHNVSIQVGSKVIERWEDYTIDIDMLTPADQFRLSLPRAKRDVFDLCAPDSPVVVRVDDAIVLTGLIDDRAWVVSRDSGTRVSVTGRDKGGRLTDESAPLFSFAGVTIESFVRKVVAPWFEKVIFSNADNRRLLRGGSTGAAIARASKEPIFTHVKGQEALKKIEPGEMRWDALSSVLEKAELLAWSTADGQSLVVGLPNYDQDPQYHFFVPKAGSDRFDEGNVLTAEVNHSVGERYSEIIVCGASQGNGSSYGSNVTKRRASARNNPGTTYGVGKDFRFRKVLLVSDGDIHNEKEALVRAKREMAVRDGQGHEISLTVQGHSQALHRNAVPALYAPDTMALVELEEIGLKALYLVTAVQFSHTRGEETTKLSLVPKGTVLRP